MQTRDSSPSARTRRAEAIGAIGTIVEWYDFSLYLYLAPVYARVFFGGDGGTSQLVQTLAIFAVAYLARPLGALYFGSFGDRRGRRPSLIWSAGIMAAALLINGLLPGEAAIGWTAAFLLFAVRLAAGFAVGGEYSGILTFLVESSGNRWRGLVASWSPAAAGIGSLLAVAVSALVTNALDQEALDSWGWRVPVLIGAGLAAATLLLRSFLPETPAFERVRAQGVAASPLRQVLLMPQPVVLAFVLSAVGAVAYYLAVTYVPTYLATYRGVSPGDALRWSTIATAALVLTTPLFGAVADAIGRRRGLMLVGAAVAVGIVPLYGLLGAPNAAMVVAASALLATIAGAWSAIAASAIPEQFPAVDRFSGIAVGYNAAVALFGGLTPLGATLLIEWTGNTLAPALACAACGLAGIAATRWMRETARRSLS